MKHILLICHLSFVICYSLPAQLPIAVSRSAIEGGAVIQLPPIAVNIGGYRNVNESIGFTSAYSISGSPFVQLSTNTFTSAPNMHVYSSAYVLGAKTITIPLVAIATNAPAAFTNTVTVTETDSYGAVGTGSQDYAFFVAEDSGTSASGDGTATTIRVDQTDPGGLEALSRKETTASRHLLMGWSATANGTNATLKAVAFMLSNNTTNQNEFSEIALWRDANANGQFEETDSLIGTTTNANGYAVFDSLTENVSTNRYLLTGTFIPSGQTRNTFLSAALFPSTVLAQTGGNTLPVQGALLLGKQYAFLDTTPAEDDAAASALNTQIRSAVDSATNALTVAYNIQLATELANAANRSAADLAAATNALAVAYAADMAAATNQFSSQISTLQQQIQTGTGGSVSSSSGSSLTKTLLPAAAAGAAAIGAAFTSDSLGKPVTSREFSTY